MGVTKAFIEQYRKESHKRRSKGICDLCGKPAPFNDRNGNPYLESHHIVWLSKGGKDEIDNVVALCPNCHRSMHVLNRDEDIEKLNHRIRQYQLIEEGYSSSDV